MFHALASLFAHLSSTSHLLIANSIQDGLNSTCGTNGANCGSNGTTLPAAFSSITKLLIFFVGAISVIMIIVGGLRYVLSAGDPKSTNDAKNTILYAVIGVVIALLSYAIVHFAVGAI